MVNSITRRRFLRLSAIVGTGALAAACAAPGPPPPTQAPAAKPTTAAPPPTTAPAPTGAKPAPTQASAVTQAPAAAPTQAANMQFQEAPQLADLVKARKLPPVEQRLPANPLVVQPVEQVGKYGGEWRSALLGGQDTAWLVRTIAYEHLMRWDRDWKKSVPNVAESVESSPDATQFTFKLRKGMKWSDGQPFTADDITFWYEDYLTNKELNPGGIQYDWMVTGADEPGKVTKVDDSTVVFKFVKPNGLFLSRLCTPDGAAPTRFPRHYLQQFHKKYNPNVDQLVSSAGVSDWVALFRQKGAEVPGTPYDARWSNPELPTLTGWVVTTGYGDGSRVVADRNPYFWKVDPEGHQLPYIDRVSYDVMQDKEVLTLKALNGEIDMMSRHFNILQNKAVFTDNMDKGQYHLFETVPSSMNTMVIALNLTHKDPMMRQMFQSKDFRIGLSHAINRKQIIDLVYLGQGEPYQLGPRPQSPLYNEKLARQYTEYDVEKANHYLDQAGFTKRDSDGFRLGPNGQRISFQVETPSGSNAEWVDALKFVQDDWKKVGVDMQIKTEDRSLLYTRKDANDHDAVVWGGDGGLEVMLETRWYFPSNHESNYAEAWFTWYNPGGNPRTTPEEPPAPVKQQMQLYEQIKATGDEQKQQELMKQLLDISADQFFAIGISLPANTWGLVKNNFHNVPNSMPDAYLYPAPAPTDPPQYFIA